MSNRLLIILIFTSSLAIILFLNSLLVPKREPNRPSETNISDLVRNEAITTRIPGISKQKNLSIHKSRYKKGYAKPKPKKNKPLSKKKNAHRKRSSNR